MSARPDEEEEWGDSDDWEYEYYYEEEEEEPESATPVVEKPEPQPHTRIIPIIIEEPAKAAPPSVSRPGSRQRRLVSRPNSRQGSRPASRNASRPCSRMKNGGLNGVKEEAEFDNEEDEDWEWEYYYEGEEDELRCMSPAATTAPTTRATSPFPNGGEKLRDDRPTVKTPLLSNAVEMTGSPHWEEAGRVSVAGVPIADNASETIHNDLLNPSKELSVALAAEYLGQKAEDVAAALPAGFAADTTSPNSVSRLSAEGGGSRKKKHKKSRKHDSDPENSEKRKKKRKSRISVKQLVDKLEPKLFQDAQTGTKMVMNETDAKSAIQSSKRILPDDPMNPRNVGRVLGDPDSVVVRDAKNPHQMQVIQGGRATVVHMRQKASDSPKLAAGQRKKKPGRSPSESSEAYGTGSTTSEGTEGHTAAHGDDHEDPARAKHVKDSAERHSRLFRLLQDSDYTDSELESGMQSPAVANVMEYAGTQRGTTYARRVESDLDSLGSIHSIERKHSFRSIKSSGNESEGDSSASGANKVSPPSMRRELTNKRFISLGTLPCYEPASPTPGLHHAIQQPYPPYPSAFPHTPSSSEVSTPSSPTFAFAPSYVATSSSSAAAAAKPKTPRVWSYLNQEFSPPPMAAMEEQPTSPLFHPTTHTMFSSTTDYMQQSLQYADSLEVETIMARGKMQRPSSVIGLSNAATSSPASSLLRQKKLPSPMAELMRNSPTYRNSPKLEMDLMDLAHLPPAPALKVQRYHQQQQQQQTQFSGQQQGFDRKT